MDMGQLKSLLFSKAGSETDARQGQEIDPELGIQTTSCSGLSTTTAAWGKSLKVFWLQLLGEALGRGMPTICHWP